MIINTKVIMTYKRLLSLLFINFLFVFLFISCKTTNTLTGFSEDMAADVTLMIPIVPKQYSNINVVPPEETDLTDEEIEEKERKANELIERTKNMSAEQRKFYYIKKTYDYEVVGRDLDYKIMVNHDYKELIIQFEESDSREDWWNNFLFYPWPLKLDKKIVWTTHGYARIYKSAKNIPIDQFCEQIEKYPDYKIIIWGWSLGSAIAKIIARHLIIRTGGKIKIAELTTYGDVRCWYNPFYSINKNCDRVREYVTWNDSITGCVPICRRDYTCHVGDKWSPLKSRDVEYYHTHYDTYDYSKWE